MALQASLLDVANEPRFAPLGGAVRRTRLARGAWFDLLPGWLTGADDVFEHLLRHLPWRAERRAMYDRVVDVPRLMCFYDERATLPHASLDAAKAALDAHYGDELGEAFATAGMCLYRDGRDSVAWHGDRIGRGGTADTMVAILSLGAPRPLLLRPSGGSTAHRLSLGHGDLFVMGGSCQRTWEHAVPKVAAGAGPRISVQFRTRGVR